MTKNQMRFPTLFDFLFSKMLTGCNWRICNKYVKTLFLDLSQAKTIYHFQTQVLDVDLHNIEYEFF